MEQTETDRRDLSRVVSQLADYLLAILPPLVNVPTGAVSSALVDVEPLEKFISNPEYGVIWIGVNAANEVFVSNDTKAMSLPLRGRVAIVKSQASALDGTKPVSSQIQLITVSNEISGPEDLESSFLVPLQRYSTQIYHPLVRVASASDAASDISLRENLASLQKRIREMEIALEQCQHGATIPRLHFPIPAALEDAAKRTTVSNLKLLTERFNPANVDELFRELSLTAVMGTNPEAQERFSLELSKVAKQWPVEIKRQTRLVESPFPGSIELEINFWRDLEKKMLDTKEQLSSAEVLLMRLMLKKINRISESLTKEAETELDTALEIVQVAVSFLRDFPLEEILSASDPLKLIRAITNSLQHFNKLKHSRYDVTRAVRLLEALGSLVFNRIVALIKERNILQCPVEELAILKRNCDDMFAAWETNLTTIRLILSKKDVRRNALQFEMEPLRQRLHNIIEFREQHERLVSVFTAVLSSRDRTVVDMHEAYQIVLRNVSYMFDISAVGASAWSEMKKLYDDRLTEIEKSITKIVEDRLSMAKSAEEMFRTFSTFNPLFFRPAIRHAVHSFRAQLVKNVRDDVKRLQDKFLHRYDESSERVTADLHDIPPLSGRIIWAKQIENQLSTLMKRLGDVLGGGLEEHREAKDLKEVCDDLRRYLDTNQLFNDWLTQQLKIDTQKYSKVKEFLFLVEDDARGKTLRVNFEEKNITLFKEVRYLEWLLPTISTTSKTLPRTIVSQAAEAYARYPVATALKAALSGFMQTKKNINEHNELLLGAYVLAVREALKEAFGGSKRVKRWVKWDSSELSEWVAHLSSKVIALQERMDELQDKLVRVQTLLHTLSTCAYKRADFEAAMVGFQEVVDEIQMKGFSNVSLWVAQLDQQIEGIVSTRLQTAFKNWTVAFLNASDNHASSMLGIDHGNSSLSASASKGHRSPPASKKASVSSIDDSITEVHLEPTVHEVLLSNTQVLYLDPPLEVARGEWIASLHQFAAVVTTLPRIITSRFNVFANTSSDPKDYSHLLKSIDADVLYRPIAAIEDMLRSAKAYAQQWLQYQALWDATPASVMEKLGEDASQLQILLEEITASRTTTSVKQRAFGPIIIDIDQIQEKVSIKYDFWQIECQTKFQDILNAELNREYNRLVEFKAKLEAIYFEGPTKDVISGIEFLLKIRAQRAKLEQLTIDLEKAERSLIRVKPRRLLPDTWVSALKVTTVFNDFSVVLERRSKQMESQLQSLQLKIKEEESALNATIEEFVERWNQERPAEGGLNPSDVLAILAGFSSQVEKLTEDFNRIRSAKEALGLEFLSQNKLEYVGSEITDLKDVWTAVSPVFDKLKSLRTILLRQFVPAKVRRTLEELADELRKFPVKIRGYAAVDSLQDKISKYISMQSILRDLSSEALKDRHWKSLHSLLGLSTSFREHIDITIGVLWECNLVARKKSIGDILSTAQGELALEVFLSDLRDYWKNCELTLAAKDGIRLVTGWDVIFTKLEDNLNSLASLKQSPYFKNVPAFQEDTSNWDSKLTQLRGIFDLWVEVQRKWVYLRGIFRNPDIKSQLPSQYSKFKSLDSEITSLMKRVASKPNAMDLLLIDNLHRQFERQDASMSIIQKALGEYLEHQRHFFPRFYFVNNDDLVEIIGNSNEPAKILVHLGKMFAGINTVELNILTEGGDGSSSEGSGNIATAGLAMAMCSKEGETVRFTDPVNVSVGVKDWLGQLELQMHHTLATLLQEAMTSLPPSDDNNSSLLDWIEQLPAQIVILASQVSWSRSCEDSLSVKMRYQSTVSPTKGGETPLVGMPAVRQALEKRLTFLSETVLHDMASEMRKKVEQLLTEMVHQRDVTRQLVIDAISSRNDFGWLYHMRYYWSPKEPDLTKKLGICMSNATFHYGFEYLGIGERLVQTPLTDRCYLTLTQALHFRMGGNPFGPAGTGKTESVKMLGSQLGRFVLVFNCDASFDYAAMGRIFAGLCQVGAWGCFDEFNRLEERILSAVSQQILTIQRGLMLKQDSIELLGQPCKLNKNVGIFVTLNPGYAGRSNLPDNLKQLFRAVAMAIPDRKMIAQVMLFSQGIVTAEELAGKIVLLFTLCEEQLSSNSHYDFGLRALKSVLTGSGELKRKAIREIEEGNGAFESKSSVDSMAHTEKDVLIKATCDSIVPKLVAEDLHLFESILQAVFPGAAVPKTSDKLLLSAIKAVCEEDNLECNEHWVEKILQLKQVLDMRHGVMMVGPTGTGKTTAWRTLLKALGRVDKVKGDFYVIDPKSIKKEKLYGVLDPNTLEWTDGVFTKILRKVSTDGSSQSSLRGAGNRRSWIIFDGDVDPEWAENLNSVLDDNKVLTLPSGDRLKLSSNVRIMMEVDTLKHATLATVSRCGMVWFAEGTIPVDVILRQHLKAFQKENVQAGDSVSGSDASSFSTPLARATQVQFVNAITSNYAGSIDSVTSSSIVHIALEYSLQQTHIMEASIGRLLSTLYSLMLRGIALVVEYNENNSDFPMTDAHMDAFATKWLLYSLLWAFGGSMTNERRNKLGELLLENSNVSLPGGRKLIDLHVNLSDGAWLEWSTMVPRMEIESHRVTSSDVVITTTDTVRHIEVLRAWLASHKPLILCGPPGSGKTMTLTSVLESFPEFVLASLNFSSGTKPDLILKTFAQYCEVVDSPEGLIMQPSRQSYRESQWLVVFCDEINLPEHDVYGTQTVIMFLRQLTEQGGFWNNDCKWVHLRRIQFVGACNPPTDAGRVPLSLRFLRHAPLLLVDYPAETSLKQIYQCFNHALLKLHPNLKGYTTPMTDAMVELYLANQVKFTPDAAPQYIYSPRELSRWVRAMYEAMEPVESMTNDELVRLWAHEALRLFHDRLIDAGERQWCSHKIDEIAGRSFAGVDMDSALQRPILFSKWLRKNYQSTDRDLLREFIGARLKVFYEEELDVPLVVFDDVIEHALRIDGVLRHPIGHLLLVGESGVGKTVLTRFVAWMNGLSVFQIKANNRYTVEQFDDDLRALLRRVGVEGEKICFIFDESNALSSAFLERMNALLASGEVPGLFEGDDRLQLMSACRESFNQREGLLLDSEDELWRRFTHLIQRNLHVVFTMNPASEEFENRCNASPALFNRCVVDWFGTWSELTLAQVGHEFTSALDTGFTAYSCPSLMSANSSRSVSTATAAGARTLLSTVVQAINLEGEPTLREAVVAALVSIHNIVKHLTVKHGKATGKQFYVSPRDYLDLIRKFVSTEQEKRSSLEDQQTHIRTGLHKLLETQDRVADLKAEMVGKGAILRAKDAEANAKLNQMVEKQNETEYKKGIAEQLTQELKRQNEEIRIRLETVERELSEAEPALVAAKQSVSNIRKAQMDELRQLARPPALVRLTMEMVCIMIGEKNMDWTEIRKIIRRDDFIALVVNFDPTNISPRQIKQIQDEYLNNPELDYASVDRSSKACGPLFQWCESQIIYTTILKKVKPLRDEVANLQVQSEELEVRQKEAVQQVEELEKAIIQYKADYATAIRETEIIRNEMEVVVKRVERAESLLMSLEQEKDRWQTTSHNFDLQMSTLIGDCLLAAAFQTYAGIFDHRNRKHLMLEWSESLENLAIPFRSELDMISYLAAPSDQMKWRGLGLPPDELALQNGILLERFHRYPLVIDPSGQATEFIINKYSSGGGGHGKILQTSFLDTSFLKTLASCIRFGNALLVHDVETIDPILNPVLNKELQKTGGRTLIRIGNEDIDFTRSFVIILTTRNPMAKFSPDLCSRVTIVNFTVTPASLEANLLSAVLHAERPDVDRRRKEMLRLQGEQNVKFRELEEALLNKISAVQGAILDDNTVINTLESIKAEAAQLTSEFTKTSEIVEDLKRISQFYEPLASAFAAVYFSLENLGDVSFLYQFSLSFFLDIVNGVLSQAGKSASATVQGSTSSSSAPTVSKQRLDLLSRMLFNEISRRVLPSLKFDDKLLFIVRLSDIALQGEPSKRLKDEESDFLLRGTGPIVMDVSSVTLQKFITAIPGMMLHEATAKQLLSLSLLSTFKNLVPSMSGGGTDISASWASFMSDPDATQDQLPMSWLNEPGVSDQRIALLKAVIIRALRPEKIIPALEHYVATVFNDGALNWREHSQVDLKRLVEKDTKASSPIMLCSEMGQDASSKVDSLASMMGKQLLQISMGSSEGYTEAERLIALGSKTGSWVLLRNVHLCIDWLTMLEKKLHGLTNLHENYRLFMTCEIHPKLPAPLLRMSEVVVFEASTGIKANLQRFYLNIPASRIDRQPAERSRLYGLLAWFHAVVQERLRYAPLGWTKKYEFTESDALCTLDVIDNWIDDIAGPKAHINPEDLPWQALKTILSQSIYGGRIDRVQDQVALDSFIDSIFNVKNYSSEAPLVVDRKGTTLLSLPDGLSRHAFDSWVKALPETNSPLWLGLPMTAETQLRTIIGQKILAKLNTLQGATEEGDSTGAVANSFPAQSTTAFGGLKNNPDNVAVASAYAGILDSITRWLDALPLESVLPTIHSEAGSDVGLSALERCLLREMLKGKSILKMVRSDLSLVIAYCKGEIKSTNYVREFIGCVSKGLVPKPWLAEYEVLKAMTISQWIADFANRIRALEKFRSIADGSNGRQLQQQGRLQGPFWLGGLFYPEAFITATRQMTAQAHQWSLEELELHLTFGSSSGSTSPSTDDFAVEGLVLGGAQWLEGALQLSDELRNQIPLCNLTWRWRGASAKESVASASLPTSQLSVPVYLNQERSNLVTDVLVPLPAAGSQAPAAVWAQRGVAFIIQQPVL